MIAERVMRIDRSGQALIELVLAGTLILGAILGSGALAERAYARLECSRKAFEAARRAAEGASVAGPAAISRDVDGVRVSLSCRTGTERVFVPALEAWEVPNGGI